MAKTIRGTKDLKRAQPSNAQVVRGAKDPRQFRCPRCKNLATNEPDGKGGTKLRCTFCGRSFATQTI